MTGETDLQTMLDTLTVERRPGSYCFVTGVDSLADQAVASIREPEGLSLIVTADAARALGVEPDFIAAWLTLGVHSALEAVGLTAAVSAVLAEVGIPCNVVAGHHHDHLFVPEARADDAVAALGRMDPSG